MAHISNDEAAWVQGVSQATGIDPRVLIAWQTSEGHPGDTAYNYLNITSQTAQSVGVPPSETLAAGTAGFANVQEGILATVREIRNLGLTHEAGKTPRQEIADIAATNWASSHYGGPGGPNLLNDLIGIFGTAAPDSPYQGSGTAGAVAGSAKTGSAADITSASGGSLTHNAATGAVGTGVDTTVGAAKTAAGAVVSAASLPVTVWNFVTSWRFAEIVGGFLLLVLGLALLGRQYGMSVPSPVPASYVPDTPAAPSGHTKGPSAQVVGDQQLRSHNEARAREDAFRDRNPGYDEVPY